ncbi:glucoamylase family protein [Cytophagaceae bacterium DM2B3-1]|uniref:Glucoamylase family protein n=1 Tax=Xanthocytophaga flava TaxID=3048013 RepID=A0ABT7CKG6_9BACT|nr:glucoamylase family protein [Xanthocytophaga flavus]MDJ1469472.1 glucoamylase family protein [Xanthocytophaga flavus]MDJ1494016.1 glucoamylase family protein [Xanthocytophaga flavus]
MKYYAFLFILVLLVVACKKDDNPGQPDSFYYTDVSIDGKPVASSYYNVRTFPVVKVSFSGKVNSATVAANVVFKKTSTSTNVPFDVVLENSDSTILIGPKNPLENLTKYTVQVLPQLQSQKNTAFNATVTTEFITVMDSTDKFPRISDEALLDLVQKQTFAYFWNFGHPTSGMARERNTSGDIVTTGGTGFGIMAVLVAVERNFITRQEGYDRIKLIANFLKTKATPYHGAFAHWINGATGATVAFSTKDNGADLVETSYLMQGLLTARQYFSNANEAELRSTINELWQNVEWSWFRKNNENVLYWHWSPNYTWDMNMQISGWNEALITYVLAASSPTYSIPKEAYTNGWARNGSMVNNKTFYSIKLPLGPDRGGPLFFAHYSFLGIDPRGLSDTYANYWEQNVAHSLINYNYCKENPKKYNGYSDSCWGLTASDDNISGYAAHEPNNDLGIISPTAALSSMPYTPEESMKALHFFYYKLGDKIWKQYGFVDAFNLSNIWYADSFLAIDQGPIIVMIENHRSQLLWNLFMSCPEVKAGLQKLSFQSQK